MATEIDVWRSANVLVERYGEEAEAEAQRRAEGFPAGSAPNLAWLDILENVKELQRVEPEEREPVH